MKKANTFIFILFFAALYLSVSYGEIRIDLDIYWVALLIYSFFTVLYYNLRVIGKKGNVNFDYGISYGLSFAIFTGPLGLLIYEAIYRVSIYGHRKWTKTADDDEFIHIFYNIGAFTLNNSIAFYLFYTLYPVFENITFGFWILIFLLAILTGFISDTFLTIIFIFWGNLRTPKEIIEFIRSRSLLDTGKTAITNGLLLLFLEEKSWEILIVLFIFNYIVSRSFLAKSQSLQNKVERDKFEQMAYTDFLTGVYNRAFMDKKMNELNESGEFIGIIVADIDKFKRINDTYNHAVGDKVIKHFASTLQELIYYDDFLFRSGGEEFTIFLRNRTYEECTELVEQIQTAVENCEVKAEFHGRDITITYTASFGLYYYRTCEYLSIEKGYVNADQLLLESKRLGKNRVTAKNGLTDLPLSVRFKK